MDFSKEKILPDPTRNMSIESGGQMMRIITVALVSLIVLMSPIRLLAHEGHTHKVMGTVAAVDANHVEIETKDGEKIPVLLNKETKYLRGKTKVAGTDIKVGERIVVIVVEKGDKKMAQEILLASKGGQASESDPRR